MTTLRPHDKKDRLAYDTLPDGTIISTGTITPADDLPRIQGTGNEGPYSRPLSDQNGHNLGPSDGDRIYDTRVWELGSNEVEIYRYSNKSQALRNHDRLIDFYDSSYHDTTAEKILAEQEDIDTLRWKAIIEDRPNDTDESPDREDTES